MRIGILVGRFPPEHLGGAELQAQQVGEELSKSGHQVLLFTRRLNNRPIREKIDGYMIHRRNVLPVPGLRMIWDTVPAVMNIALSQPRPDVLLCYQTLNSGLIGIVAQGILGIPSIISIRGNREYRLKNSRINRCIVPPIYHHARRIVVQSGKIREDMDAQLRLAGRQDLYEGIFEKIRVIPNGINLHNFERCKGRKIIYIGRLIKGKGVSDLIVGIRQLPKYEILIIGDGPERRHLETLASGMSVTFTGEIMPDRILEYFKEARVLVLPSYIGDGMPNVILEAMACGIPVVATRIAGVPDLVEDGETGFLFETGDIQQMVTYIRRLMSDDQLWNRQGSRSLEKVQAYSWEQIIPQLEQLLKNVIETA